MLRENFVSFLMYNNTKENTRNCVYTEAIETSSKTADVKSVSYLHTGSIPSQFGKPLMTLGNFPAALLR